VNRARVGAWALVAAWGLLIFTLSSFPLAGRTTAIPGGDKTAHVAEYAVLGFLLARALGPGGAAVLRAALLGALYGLTDEFHQSFVPERSASAGDLAADAVGALLGAAARGLTARGTSAPGPGPSGPGGASQGPPATPRA
jgi:VanZ family protein